MHNLVESTFCHSGFWGRHAGETGDSCNALTSQDVTSSLARVIHIMYKEIVRPNL